MKKVVIMDEDEYQAMQDKIDRYENPQPTVELTGKQIIVRVIISSSGLLILFFHNEIGDFLYKLIQPHI